MKISPGRNAFFFVGLATQIAIAFVDNVLLTTFVPEGDG
jgi:hypothetical protein